MPYADRTRRLLYLIIKLRKQGRQYKCAVSASLAVRRAELKRKYNITPEELDALVEQQGNVCAICQVSLDEVNRTAVDHDHTTGVVRGVLCFSCNVALGHFKDDVDILRSAIAYLGAEFD